MAPSNKPRSTRMPQIFLSPESVRAYGLSISDLRCLTSEKRGRCRGFTLLELLVVIGIVALLMVLIVPAFTNIKSGTDVTSAAYTIKGVLDTARTYAKANNTYTWVGFKEVDVSRDASVSPQIDGTGRVAIAIVASKDGTRGYDITNPSLSNPAWTNYNNGTNLIAIGKLQYLDNVHLAGTLTMAGNMARPNV